MSIFKRLFNIGKSEANAALDSLEDPVKMTEQGIRDLKNDLNESLKGLAEVKAVAIRTRKDLDAAKQRAGSYEQKAMLLLQKANSGELEANDADRLATEALSKKEQADNDVATQSNILKTQESNVSQMEQNISKLKSQISKWENEAKTLKARARVSKASEKLNKTLANVDSSSTMAMLERMKEKVDQQEALAESYADMADANTTVDDEINKALGTGSGTDSLLALKAKMGLLKESNESKDEDGGDA